MHTHDIHNAAWQRDHAPGEERGAPVAAIVLVAVAILVPLGVGWWRAQHADTNQEERGQTH